MGTSFLTSKPNTKPINSRSVCKAACSSVVNSPIPRGIKTHGRRGDLVELYVKRGDLPFNRNLDWTLEQFQAKTVIGVARQHDGNWNVVGQVTP